MLTAVVVNIPAGDTPSKRPILFGLGLTFIIWFVIAIISVFTYTRTQIQNRVNSGKELLAIALSVRAAVDGDAFERLFTPPAGLNDEKSLHAFMQARINDPDYRRIKELLIRVIRSHGGKGFSEQNIYTFAPDPLKPGEYVRYGVVAHDKPFTGKRYRIPAAMAPVLKGTLQGDLRGAYSDLYLSTDSRKYWLSAYAPIQNSAGKVVGIIDVAWQVEKVLGNARREQARDLLLIFGMIVAGVIASLALLRIARRLAHANSELAREIAEREKAQGELHNAAYFDTLTGLPNRNLFLVRLEVSRANLSRPFAVLFLDLDRFKNINDSLGYVIGDELIKATARALTEALPGDVLLARPGEDEFALLIHDAATPEEARHVIALIHKVMAGPFKIEGHEIPMTASMGVYLGTERSGSAEDILRNAETAMFRARQGGRGQTEFFTTDMHVRTISLLRTENDLRRAVDRDEFRVFYQPVVSLADDSIVGFEALVRWQHPERGLLGPGGFIPLAEETGLIAEIGRQVMRKACAQLAEWRKDHPERNDVWMSVNFSPHQFRERTLREQIEYALATGGLPERNFKMEITESIAMDDVSYSAEVLRELSERAIRISIDDFGTGHSSLSYLSRFPIHTLKIDKSFLDNFRANPGDGGIIKAILAMARSLNMYVIAEGVETREQMEFLREQGCQAIQGYLISKPVPAAEAEQLFSAPGVPTGE